MYEQRFGLKRRPFPATPDDAFYYPATGHEAALASLVRAVRDEEGLALLTGEPGTGKTLLGQGLSERVGQSPTHKGETLTCSPPCEGGAGGDNVLPTTVCAFLPNSHFADRSALLQAILYDLQLPYEDGGEQILRLRFTEYLLKCRAADQRVILILDEAHHLSIDLLEELRLLGNLEAGGKKALQIVLLAQPAFLEKIACPELASFRQRLFQMRCELGPLGVEEAVDYFVHHLRQASGIPENIIDEAGLEVLARGTKGVPRLLNQAGQQALVLADSADLSIVDSEAALEALALIGLGTDSDEAGSADEAVAEFEIGPRLAEPIKRTA